MVRGRYGSMASALMRQQRPSFSPQQGRGFFGVQPISSPGVQPFSPQSYSTLPYQRPAQPPTGPGQGVTPFANMPKPEYTLPVQPPAPQGVTPTASTPNTEFTQPVQPTATPKPGVTRFGKRPEYTSPGFASPFGG